MEDEQVSYFKLREKELGFRPQNEVVYNSILPYSDHIDEESKYALTAIKRNLTKAVLLRDLRPGVAYWTSQLIRYIRLYGLKFSKSDHVHFIKLFYELVTSPGLEGVLVEQICGAMGKLLKKRHLLSRKDLLLDWVPLYKLSEQLIYSKMEPMGLEWIPPTVGSKINGLIRNCRSYFPPASTQAMLDEWRPLLCPFDVIMSKACKYLDLFVPTLVFSREESESSWRLWINEILALWKSAQNGPTWEKNLVHLLARFAHNNIGYFDWEPFVSQLCTRLLRSMQLPVGKLQHTSSLTHQLPIETASLWLISMMGRQCSKIVLQHLRHFFDATGTYFHPSNTGKWCGSLLNFLQNIAAKFAARVHRERYKTQRWEPKVPESHLLQDSDIEEFVLILKPVALMTLYSKIGPTMASKVLLILSNLRPDLILPELVDKTYIALGTLTEPHQVRSCLSALSCSISPGIREFPEVRKHIIPLLFQCLPALDPNDLTKSLLAFQFISTALSMIPVVNCSRAVQLRTDLNEEELELCNMTDQFEDFASQYMERLFVLLEGLSQGIESHSVESSDDRDVRITQSEGISGMILVTSTAILLQQSSTDIYRLCLDKVFRFATTNLLAGFVAMSTTATLCAATVKINPAEGYAKFVPYLCNEILEYFAETPEAKTEEKLDKKLLWDLKILSEICHNGTEHLLQYKDLLYDVASHGIEMTAKDGYQTAIKIIKYCIRGWTIFFCSDRRSLSYSIDQDPAEYLAIRDWGKISNPRDLDMKWHIPSEKELNAAFECFDRFFIPALQELSDFNADKCDLTKEELRKILYLVKEVLMVASVLLPEDDSGSVCLERDSVVSLRSWPVLTTELLPFYNSCILKSGHSNIRKRVFEITHGTLQKLLSCREDDVKSVCFIVDIYSQCSLMHEQQKAEFDQHWKVFTTYKNAMKNPLRQKKQRERLSLIDRAVLQHQMRVLAIERSNYTSLHHGVMLDLIQLSTSHYMKVRGNAQALFFHGLTLVPSSAYRQYLPLILKHLDKANTVSHQELKGALYLLIGKPKSRSFLGFYHRWDAIAKVWPALIAVPHSEKPSIAKLYDKLALKIQAYFNSIAIESVVSSESVQAAVDFIQSNDVPEAADIDIKNVIEEGEKHSRCVGAKNKGLYESLVNSLIDLYETGNLTWKYVELVLGMLSLLLRHDIQIPRLTKLFLSLLTDDVISVRTLALACVGSIMKQQKRKHAVEMLSLEDITGHNDTTRAQPHPGDRVDNSWHQYNSKDLPTNQKKFDNTKFVDKTHWGYYAWPKLIKTYAHYEKQPKLDRERDELNEGEVAVYDFFTNSSSVEKLINFLCLENVKGKDKFDDKRMDMFRGLFRNYGDTFVPLFKPNILRLVEEKQESHQRCAAEIITGIAMGSKHWPFEKVNNMWDWMIPTLKKAVANISTETTKDWDKTFTQIVQNRDPRRIYWVLDFLANEPATLSNTVLVESSKLFIFQGGIHQQEWRVPEILQKMLNHVEPLLGHQYKSIRNRIGSVLASIFLYDVEILGKSQKCQRTPSAAEFVKRVLPRLEILLSEDTPPLSNASSETSVGSISEAADQEELVEDYSMPLGIPVAGGANISGVETLPPEIIHQIQEGLKKLLPPGSPMPDLMRARELQDHLPVNLVQGSMIQKARKSGLLRPTVDESAQTGSDTERNETIRIYKTVMKWIVSAQRSTMQPFRSCFLQLLPLICKLYPVDKQGSDEELHRDTRLCLSCLAQSIVQDDDISKVVDTIRDIVDINSWHARHTILSYIQVFVYSNLFSVGQNKSIMLELREIIISLLQDDQYEVSRMASITLSGLIQCGAIDLDDELLQLGYDMCSTKLKRKKKTGANDVEDVNFQKRLLKRHAGVLILSACVLSSPYSVPDWMPRVVMRLSDHLHDIQPIQGTIKRTLSDFRRTHHDNWHEDKLKFSSDELAVLTDLLVSPSYYA
ncbi:proteasome activator complex subunit 4A-like [Clavelina lepadiformis]|uniref:proteasome activator complex subunit 4A-like n=1 Tax=Clavelina lepadiformis TaxID=159417 RepID=UPI0040435D5E